MEQFLVSSTLIQLPGLLHLVLSTLRMMYSVDIILSLVNPR